MKDKFFVSSLFKSGLNNRGFTMVELLVSMTMATVVALAGFTLFSSSNWSYMVQEDVGETQQNLRVAMDMLASDLRHAGFGLPKMTTNLGFDTTGDGFDNLFLSTPVTVTVSGGTGAPDSITLLGLGYEAGMLVGGSDEMGENTICIDDGGFDNFSTASVQVRNNRKHISIGGTKYSTVSGFGTGCVAPDRELVLTNNLPHNYEDETPIFIIQAINYAIVTTEPTANPPCTPDTPCLRTTDHTALRGNGAQTLATSIEDLQLAYGIDSSTSYNDNPDPDDVVAVRATIVARTETEDPKERFTMTRPGIEDRNAGPTDGFRRRLLTKVVKLRNR